MTNLLEFPIKWGNEIVFDRNMVGIEVITNYERFN